MTKKEEKNIMNHIITLMGESITESDYILIHDLIDWVKISEKAKEELQESVKTSNSMPWQTLTTIAMSSKQIQNIMQRLNITPDKRSKNKKTESKEAFDLQEFLKD